MTKDKLQEELKEIAEIVTIGKELDILFTEYSKKSWTQYTVGYDFGLQQAHENITEKLKNKNSYELIKKYLDKDLTPNNKRRVELLEKTFRPYHKSQEIVNLDRKISDKVTELSKLLNTFRPQLKGKDISAVEINKILKTEQDRELRKEAYLARTQINKHLVDQGFIDLLKMRNEYAQLNGFKNFVEYRLDGDELNIDLFKDWKEQASKGKEERIALKQKLGQKHLGINQVMPWDGFMLSEKMFPYSQKEVDMLNFYEPIRDLFSKFGFDIDSMNITYDVYSRKNKSEWGYNFTIENGKDSRILANIKNEYTYFNVMLHETGHAVHSFSTNPDDFLMNSGISGIISEGIANLFGSFTKEEIFYKQFFSAEELPTIAKQMQEAKEYGQLNKLRSVDEILFDQHLYLEDVKSLADINDLKWKFRKDVHGTGAYPGENEPIWGYTIHHTTHPIYLHNYLMGTISYEMLKSAFCQRFNKKDIMEAPLEFGNFLRTEVMETSGRYPYLELVKRFSGKEFSLV